MWPKRRVTSLPLSENQREKRLCALISMRAAEG